jgi:hypothetical protein
MLSFNILVILLLLIAISLLVYIAFFKKYDYATQIKDNSLNSLAGAYTDCTQYTSQSGCTKSKLNCIWDKKSSSCSSNDSGGGDSGGGDSGGGDSGGGDSGGGDSGGGDSGGGDSGGGDSGGGGDDIPPPSGNINIFGLDGQPKNWILMVKLGSGGNNCSLSGKAFSCNFLYADSSSPSLQMVNSFTADSKNSKNPAYQLYQLSRNNKWVSWNDGGSKSCNGASGYAHDKGIIVYNNNEGIYCQHSNPNWGFFDTDFLDGGGSTPGIQTELAQHMLFIKLATPSDISNIVNLMNQANVCLLGGSINGFNPCVNSGSCSSSYLQKTINGITIVAKPKGSKGDDVWSYLKSNYCGNSNMDVGTYCSPICPLGNGQSKNSVNGIVDIKNSHAGSSFFNTTCNLKFDSFSANHSKIGVCVSSNSDVVIIGGNNHSTESQGPRGGLFVILKNKNLASDFRCLFA